MTILSSSTFQVDADGHLTCPIEASFEEVILFQTSGVPGEVRDRPPPLDPNFIWSVFQSEVTESKSSSGFVKGVGWWWSGPTTTSGSSARSPEQLQTSITSMCDL